MTNEAIHNIIKNMWTLVVLCLQLLTHDAEAGGASFLPKVDLAVPCRDGQPRALGAPCNGVHRTCVHCKGTNTTYMYTQTKRKQVSRDTKCGCSPWSPPNKQCYPSPKTAFKAMVTVS